MTDAFFIGELAKRTGASTKAIRYYEDLGLLSEARRSEAGYRLYTPEDAERIRFVLGAKALGLSLAEIKDIVGLVDHGERPCGHVSGLLEEKLAELDRRIRELTAFRDELRAYKARVDAQGSDPDVACAHIAGAASGEWQPSVEPEHTGPRRHT